MVIPCQEIFIMNVGEPPSYILCEWLFMKVGNTNCVSMIEFVVMVEIKSREFLDGR